MKITISETARISLEEIVDFLQMHWTKKEIAVLNLILRNSDRQLTIKLLNILH
ncbi:hypothetical protein QE422_001547 [Chryseobacterium sp. SORGH_AS 447]|nr:hypothetical protein [Chryseobacterium sp. SORGH_AS_0447]